MAPADRFIVLTGRARRAIERGVAIDTRALAAFRIACGLLILADLVLRSRNFTFFYTEDGVVPRSLARELSPDYAVSVYYLTTDTTVIAGLFVLQGLFAVALIVGYRTGLATILSFLFVVSLDYHNPLVLSYADVLFRLLLFWAIFLPLGERWSVDAVHATRKSSSSVAGGHAQRSSIDAGDEPRETVTTVASAAILLQLITMYVVNGVHKLQSDLWLSGRAAPKVLGLDEMTYLLGDVVREFPLALQVGGLVWLAALLASPLLLVLSGRTRWPLVGVLMTGHLSFALTVRIGAFAYVALAGLLLFVQEPFWRDAARLLRRVGFDTPSYAGLRHRGIRLAGWFPDVRLDSPRLTRARRVAYTTTLAVVVVTTLAVGVVLAANVTILMDEGTDREEVYFETLEDGTGVSQVATVADALGIKQPTWTVFAPEPRTTDRYYVFPALTESGETYDVYADRPLSFERPTDQLQTQHDTYRERFYMNSVRRGGYRTDTAALLAEHLCSTWQTDDGDRLTHVNMYVVEESVTWETIDAPADRDQEIDRFYRHGCGAHEPREIDSPAQG